METQPNSNKANISSENELLNGASSEANLRPLTEQQTIGIHNHNYTPKHSSHGRLNVRGIGFDHEPGTMR